MAKHFLYTYSCRFFTGRCNRKAAVFKTFAKSQANPDWRSYWILLSKPDFLRPALVGGLGYGVLIAFNTSAPFMFQKYYRWTSSEYGLLGWPISVTYFIGALIVNRLVSRTGRLLLILLGMRLMLCGCGMMVLGGILTPTLASMIWLPYCLIVLGQAVNYPVSLSMAADSSPTSRPYAIALSGFMHQLIAAAIGGIASLISSQSPSYLSIMCLLLTAGAYLCLAFPGSKAAQHKR
jgi:MFS family permease